MPRRPRLFIPGAIYHVYCRVARGEFVFDDEREAAELAEAVQEARDFDGWEALAWCLMGNHAVERYGLRPPRVAAALVEDPTAVSHCPSKGLRLQLEAKALADRIDTLHRALSDSTCDNAEMPRLAPPAPP